MRSLAMTYFRIGTILSSALVCFTVLFEMGRSGTKPLWSPNVNCQIGKPLEKNFFRYLLFNQLYFGDKLYSSVSFIFLITLLCIYIICVYFQSPSNDRVKPHEQLVWVSFTRYRASTPHLSTSWSRTTL